MEPFVFHVYVCDVCVYVQMCIRLLVGEYSHAYKNARVRGLRLMGDSTPCSWPLHKCVLSQLNPKLSDIAGVAR